MNQQNLSPETQRYENANLWDAARYLADEAELKRFGACMALLPQATSLLDVGTGNGAFLRYLEDQRTSYSSLVGIERSQAARDAAACKAEIRLGSIENLPIEDKSFDVVSALEVIEHLPYGVYEKSLSELERIAKVGILISVPYLEDRQNIVCPYCGCHFHPNYHMRRFDLKVISDLFPVFKLVNYEIVTVPEYVIMPIVRLVRRFAGKVQFPTDAICPQCSFHKSSQTHKAATRRKQPSSFIPKRNRPNWIVALYAPH